jgi:hypothetical protein
VAATAGRRGAAAEDAVALLLVGLVREGAELFPTFVRGFFFAAPVSEEAAGVAGEELEAADEDRVLLDSAVKARDGFFTTFFVSPYSKYLARFAARRGWTPNAVTIASLAIGIAAAASFATGSRAGLIAGAILLQVSFSVDCVDGQLARYTRTFSKLGAWLDSVFDRTKEYVVYAGLAIGATRGFDDDVWVLAAVALTLQTVRHLDDFSWGASRRGPAAQPSRKPPLDEPYDAGPPEPLAPLEPVPAPVDVSLAWRVLRRCYVLARGVWRAGVRWGHRILRFPIGERFILISVTAAIWSPRVTFVALLVWGALAAAYTLVGRLLIAFDNPRAVRAVPK